MKSPLLTRWIDPVTGVVSHILDRRAAPLQQSFYYTHPSMTEDGRYYWFYCAFPPSGDARDGRSLAVADFVEHTVTHFPDAHFREASPLVDRSTGEVYWCEGDSIYKRSPRKNDAGAIRVNRLAPEWVKYRNLGSLATHLTFSADKKNLNIDTRAGREWMVGHAPLDGGAVVTWQTFERLYNHGQFSPTDPDLQLIAQDYGADIVTGKITAYENRMWLIRKGGRAEPVFAANTENGYAGEAWNAHLNGEDGRSCVADPRALHGHEWWDADGEHIWYIHYGRGVERVPLDTRKPELVWPLKTISHAHASADGRWLAGDNQPPQNPADSRVLFFNRETGREIEIVSHMPRMGADFKPYHIDPHPQFCFGDRLVCYTTMVRGQVDVAFCDVAELVKLTG
ncbi:MAG: hypothetical protein WC205_05230 [Opitutaceae bacterium]